MNRAWSEDRRVRNRLSHKGLPATGILLGSLGVWAETQGAGEDPLAPITVTAQKREQSAQEIPMSVTAVSGADLDGSASRDFHDVLLSIPGVSYSGVESGQSRYSIRGISTTAASPTVGIYLDDISLVTINNSFSGASDPTFVDLERIEVLKGPQGTLYGGSAMGGAIKYVSRIPVMNQFSVGVDTDLASIDHGGWSYSAESVVNLPLANDRLAIRLAGDYRFDGGYVSNIANGAVQVWTESNTLPPAPFTPVTYPSQSRLVESDDNTRRTSTVRLSGQYVVENSLVILPIATLQHSDKANPDEFFTNLPRFENTARFNQPTIDVLNVYSLDVSKTVDSIRITWLTGEVDRHVELDRDFSLFVGELVPALLGDDSYNSSITNSRTFSQELRAMSSDSSSPWQWLSGAYYSQQSDDLAQWIDTAGAGKYFGSGTNTYYSGNQSTKTRQKALFGDLSYAWNTQWTVDLGLRWFDIKQRVDGAFDGVFNGGPTSIDDKRSTNVGVTPRLALSYRFADDDLVYATAAKGFRPGGPNRFNTDSPLCAPDLALLGLQRTPDAFRPDDLWTYELGTKNQLKDEGTTLNAAIYYTDWRQIQQQVTLPHCAFSYIGNAGAASVRGVEWSAVTKVGFGWRVGGNLSYINSRITQSGLDVPAHVGQPLLDTPRWEGNAYSEYRVQVKPEWEAQLHAEYQYHGTNLRQFTPDATVTYPNGAQALLPDPTAVQSGYGVVNLSCTFQHGLAQFRILVDNLLDAEPFLDFRRAPGFSAATTLRPRTIGIAFKTTFR